MRWVIKTYTPYAEKVIVDVYSVAVENARPEVKKAAKEVTESNEQDGVAKWLDRFLGKRKERGISM